MEFHLLGIVLCDLSFGGKAMAATAFEKGKGVESYLRDFARAVQLRFVCFGGYEYASFQPQGFIRRWRHTLDFRADTILFAELCGDLRSCFGRLDPFAEENIERYSTMRNGRKDNQSAGTRLAGRLACCYDGLSGGWLVQPVFVFPILMVGVF